MMKNHNTTWRSVLSMLLIACMVFSLLPITAFANANPSLNLVSLGDSMTNGYGLDGYLDDDDNVNGFLQFDVKDSYPARLAKYLGSQYNVNWEQLAISCMRPEDINFLLRFKVGEWDSVANTVAGKSDWNDAKADWNTFIDEDGDVLGDFYTWDEFVRNRFNDFKDAGYVDSGDYPWTSNPTVAYAKYFQDAVKNADVITLGVGNSNFGVIAIRNLLAAAGMSFNGISYRDDKVSTEEFLIDRLDEDVLPIALLALAQVKAIAAEAVGEAGLPVDMAEKLAHSLVYTTMSMMVNYWEMLKAIDELNDKENLDVIMVDLINTMDDVDLILPDGTRFELGEALNTLFDVMSACLFAMPVIRQDVGNFENITFYAVPNDTPVEMLNADMSSVAKIKENELLRDRMITSFVDTICPLLGYSGVTLNRSLVETYESIQTKLNASPADYVGALTAYNAVATAAGSTENANKLLTLAAVYVAFEQAIANNATDSTIDLQNLMPLFGGNLVMAFTSLTDALNNIDGPMPYDNNPANPDAVKAFEAAVRKSVLIASGVATDKTNATEQINQIKILKAYVEGKISLMAGADPLKPRLERVVANLNKILADTETVIPTLNNPKGTIKIYTPDSAFGKDYYSQFGDTTKWFTSGKAWYDVDFTLENGNTSYSNNPLLLQFMALDGLLQFTFATSADGGFYKENDSFEAIMAPYAPFLKAFNAAMGSESSLKAALAANNDVYGDLLMLFARMIVGDGIGSHPSVNGHKTIYNNILATYGKGIKAKELLRNRVWDAENEFCALVAEYGPEAFDKVLAFAVDQGLITAEQSAMMKEVATNLVNAINAGDAEAIAYNSALIAGGIYMFAEAQGWIPAEVRKFFVEAIEIVNEIKNMTEEELKAFLCDLCVKMINEHGEEAIAFVEAYIVDQGWLTAEQVAMLDAQVREINRNYKVDPEYAKKELVKDLVHWLYDVGVEQKIIDPAVIDEVTAQLLELKKYIEIMETPVNDGKIEKYVSLGASFTNGYGLLDYLGKDFDYEKAVLDCTIKNNANSLGYQNEVEESYPWIIADALGLTSYDQLAISSMRAEEVRILLEDGYLGDSYSAWRFLGEGKWFDIADGVEDGNYKGLADEYKSAVADADLITLDLAMNNFGVYLSYQLTSGFSLDNDVNLIDPAVGALYADMKAFVAELLNKNYPGMELGAYEQLLDTFAYALIGYCYNFDAVLKNIYTLNPDVQVVVISAQNLLDGLKLDLGGEEVDIGYLVGALINVANSYMAVGSPYAAKYLFADVRKDGHVELNADIIANYTGSVASLPKEMLVCFDILDGNPDNNYESNIHIQYQVHKYLAANWKYIYAIAVDEQKFDFATSTKYFEAYDGVGDQTTLDSFLALDFTTVQGLTDADRANLIKVQDAVGAKYTFVLNNAYDAYAQILAAGANVDTLTLAAVSNTKSIQKALEEGLLTVLQNVMISSLDNAQYSFTLPATLFGDIATACNVTEADVKSVLALAVRTSIGNSFFAHPSKTGHAEMAEIVCEALYNKTTGKDVMKHEIEFAAKKLYEAVTNFGIAKFEEARQYVIDNGYATVEELAALSAVTEKMANALVSQDDEALKAACEEFAELAYAYADVRGYIPSEAKLALNKFFEVYFEYVNKTEEEIIAEIAEELEKFVNELSAEALVALKSYIVSQGWMTEEELAALDAQLAAIIAAYKVDPEGTAKVLVKELAGYLFATAVAEDYIDLNKVAEVTALVGLVKGAYEYFVNTPEEQIKADAINALFCMIDKLVPEYIDETTAAQIKADIIQILYLAENYTAEELLAMAEEYVEAQKALYQILLDLATHGPYLPDEDSYYVALGGGTVYGLGIGRSEKTYTELVKEYYEVEGASFGKEILLPTEILEFVTDNAEELSKADLITYQLDASAFILSVMSEEAPEWNNYFTPEQLEVINATLDVIVEILNDDWNKYVAWNADEITEELKGLVIAELAKVHGEIYEELAAGNREIVAVFDACVKYLQTVAQYLQDKATIAAKTLIKEIKWVDELFVKVENELAKIEYASIDWICLTENEAEEVIAKVAGAIFALEDAVDAETRAIIAKLVAEIVKLHAQINKKLAAFDDRLNAKEHVMEAKLFNLIKEIVVAEWPYFEGKTAADVHNDIYNKIAAAVNEKKAEFEGFIIANVDSIDALIEAYADLAIEYVETAFDNINGAVGMVEAKHEEFKAMVRPYLDAVLLENWAGLVGQNADFIKQTIETAVDEKLSAADAEIRAYVDANAAEFNAILSVVVDEIQTAVAKAQAEKQKVADIVNGLAPAYDIIEKFLYAVVAYAVETDAAVDAIREVNPDAQLVVVGMYNPLAGLKLTYNGETVDVGIYADYFVELTNAFYANLAIAKGNFTFVAVPETETNGFDVEINLDEVEINKIGATLVSLYSKMHADANGHEYIYKQIINALYDPTVAPEIVDFTFEVAEVSFEDNYETAVISCDEACVVMAQLEDGSYVVLEAEAREDGTHAYDLSGISGEFALVLALKGDYNLDGRLTTNDVAQANKAIVDETEIDQLKKLIFGQSGDGEITTNDVARVNRAIVEESGLNW